MATVTESPLDLQLTDLDPRWARAVTQVSTRAAAVLSHLGSELAGRLERATALAFREACTRQPDGSWLVVSNTDPPVEYRVVGLTCTCKDFTLLKAPEGWCKHRLATGIQHRATMLLFTEAAEEAGSLDAQVQEVLGTGETSDEDVSDANPADMLPATLPPTSALDAVAAHLQAWRDQRCLVTTFIAQILVEGVDYGRIHVSKNCEARWKCQDPYHFSKPTLFKAGSEKLTDLGGLRPVFVRDTETWEMLGSVPGLLCFKCQLVTQAGEIVAEGRGARNTQKDGNDPNKTVKMAQKSAQIDAVLRRFALSDAFTQDLEDMHGTEESPPTAPPAPPQEPGEGWCGKHQVQMQQTTKNGDTWWWHKTGDSFCRGK